MACGSELLKKLSKRGIPGLDVTDTRFWPDADTEKADTASTTHIVSAIEQTREPGANEVP